MERNHWGKTLDTWVNSCAKHRCLRFFLFMSSETQTLLSRTVVLKQKILELGKMKERKLQVVCCMDESFRTKFGIFPSQILVLCSLWLCWFHPVVKTKNIKKCM